MNTTTLKNSLSMNRIAAAALLFAAVGVATPATAKTEAKTVMPKATATAATKVTKAAVKADAKARPQRTKLPREWVWTKYAKNFDSMYRK